MARGAFWTIIVDDQPTAFRATARDDLLPTLKQIQRQHATAVIRWFQRGRLWDTPGDAQDARRPVGAERRGAGWRPGGAHKDPRDKYKLPRDVKRKRWAQQAQDGRGPFAKSRPRTTPGDSSAPPDATRSRPPARDRQDRAWTPKPDRASGRPPRAAEQGEQSKRPAPGDRRPPAGDRLEGRRPPADSGKSSWSPRPASDRPRSNAPSESRRPPSGAGKSGAGRDNRAPSSGDRQPRADEGTRGSWTPRPPGDRPRSTDRPRTGERPDWRGRPESGKPASSRPPSADRRPPSADRPPPDVGAAPRNRPSGDRRPPSGDRRPPSADRRPPSVEKRSDTHRPPSGGGRRDGFSSRPPQRDTPAASPKKTHTWRAGAPPFVSRKRKKD